MIEKDRSPNPYKSSCHTGNKGGNNNYYWQGNIKQMELKSLTKLNIQLNYILLQRSLRMTVCHVGTNATKQMALVYFVAMGFAVKRTTLNRVKVASSLEKTKTIIPALTVCSRHFYR